MGTFRPFEWLYLLAALLLLALSGVFAAAEIGFLSVNRFRVHQLAEDGSARAKLLQRMLLQPSHLLTVILILITALHYFDESLVTYWLHVQRGYPEWVPFVGLLVLILIFAEITPISYAAANPERVASHLAPLIAALDVVLHPIVAATSWLANGFVRLLGGKPPPKPLVTGEEVLTIVDIETERGVLEEEEKELIHSIFAFTDTIAREIMVPRTDIVAISSMATIGDAIDIVTTEHFSRLPIYTGDIDHISGLAYAKDLLPYQFRGDTAGSIAQVLRPATFVPETKSVSELLQEFRENKQTIAIVLDEYGGTAGLITVEDLLEEIVGEIYDEYDIEQIPVEWLDDRTLLVDGKFPVDEVSELLHHDLPEGEYDTIGGLLYSQFGDVPGPGEQVEIDGYYLIVEKLDGHRIAKVRIVAPSPIEPPEGE